MEWTQNYDPFGNAYLSTAVASLPVIVLLTSIAALGIRIHLAALFGLAVALGVAILGFGMPASMAGTTALYGAAYGLFPIGWIILNLIFLYQLTVDKGHFDTLRASLARLAPDPRVQVILVAFAFGAFFEGAAGFGTPVAVTGAILIQLGFKPLAACGLSLIANTAPVAFGAMGTPIIALAGVTGIPDVQLSAMIGRQLPFFSFIVPFWVVCAFAGFRGMLGVWPAALTAGLAFAIPQYLISNFHGPSLVDVVASLCSLGATALLLKVWKPREIWPMEGAHQPAANVSFVRGQVAMAWLPWIILSLWVFAWGEPHLKKALNDHTQLNFAIPGLDKFIFRAPPVAVEKKAEAAVFAFNWLTATGTAILLSAIVSGFLIGYSVPQMARTYARTIHRLRFSLITIAAMLALGYVTKYSGADATLGLALAHTGALYPFFGTLLGWLGVALTGSDTASNVLFGSLQKITAQQTGLSPILMAAANSSGGVMGKMVDAQSIVVASTATNWYGHEGAILRFVFWHSLALASLVGILVFFQAYVAPFTSMVVK
jgi:lactate permease